MPGDKAKKNRDLEFGRFAEDRAADHYISNGYAIKARNWRCSRIEIDLIAQKDNIVAFVEVKARSGRDTHPLDAVTPEKMKRMSRGAHIFLNTMQGDLEYRFDIFTLTGDFQDFRTEVFEDAFLSPLLK